MSRPIDADALKDAIIEKGQRNRRYKLSETWELNRDEIWDVINAQPTVELERKKAHWVGYNADNPRWLRDDGEPIFLTCSECENTVMNNGSSHWRFCPKCGCRMMTRGEQ